MRAVFINHIFARISYNSQRLLPIAWVFIINCTQDRSTYWLRSYNEILEINAT